MRRRDATIEAPGRPESGAEAKPIERREARGPRHESLHRHDDGVGQTDVGGEERTNEKRDRERERDKRRTSGRPSDADGPPSDSRPQPLPAQRHPVEKRHNHRKRAQQSNEHRATARTSNEKMRRDTNTKNDGENRAAPPSGGRGGAHEQTHAHTHTHDRRGKQRTTTLQVHVGEGRARWEG